MKCVAGDLNLVVIAQMYDNNEIRLLNKMCAAKSGMVLFCFEGRGLSLKFFKAMPYSKVMFPRPVNFCYEHILICVQKEICMNLLFKSFFCIILLLLLFFYFHVKKKRKNISM